MTVIDVPEAAVTRRRPRLRTAVVAVAVVLAGYYLITLFQVWHTGRTDEARPVDAIVVLGAAQYDGRPSPQLANRLDHVVALWKRDLAPWVVVTGGKLNGDRFTEAEASRKYLVAHGVPSEAILQETSSHNTYDSLRGVHDLLAAKGLRRVLLVSDPFHMLRSELTADELGLSAVMSPAPNGSAHVLREMKEAAGVSLGRIIGFRRLLSITG